MKASGGEGVREVGGFDDEELGSKWGENIAAFEKTSDMIWFLFRKLVWVLGGECHINGSRKEQGG